eukprot:g16261.t1
MAMLHHSARMATLVVICLFSLTWGLKVMRFPTKVCSTGGSGSSTSNSKTALKIQAPPKAAAVSPTQGLASAEDNFNWEKAWYPVLSEVDTDPERAHAVKLLGKDLVVWRNSDGRWAAFDDRCPHRAAPLTAGRVEKDGSLLCTYHAWRFDSDGKCLDIPQSDKGGKDESNPRACAKVYPTQVAQGIVWVWGENGPDAVLESLLTKPALVSALEDKEGIKTGKVLPGALMMRDVAYSWDTFMENIMDPAHVVVSHHGLMGARSMAKPLSLEATPMPEMTKNGFVVDNNSPQFGAKQGVATFYPPALVEIITELGDGTKISLVQYNIPTKPGWSRMLQRQMTILPENRQKKKVPSLLKMIDLISPLKLQRAPNEQRRWIQHLRSHLFVHQDMPLLHHQEKILASTGHTGSRWSQGIFTPTESDKGVHTLRKWLNKFGSGGPPWPEGCETSLPPREHNDDIICDTYQQHTKDCTACLGALKRVEQCILATKVSAVLSLAGAVVNAASAVSRNVVLSMAPLAPGATPPPLANIVLARAILPGVLVGLAFLRATKALLSLRKMFYVYTYVHQEHD